MVQANPFVLEIEHKTLQLLNYLKNDDGCWGKHKTQMSRLTNTCEAVWCHSFASTVTNDLSVAIELIKNAVLGKNPCISGADYLNCDIPRDYGWALIALSSIGELKSLILSHALEYLQKHQTENGGFCTRDAQSESLFNSAIVAIGLIGALKTCEKDFTNDINGVLNNLSLYFTSCMYNNEIDTGEFPYSYYAMALMKKHGLIKDNVKFWAMLENKALSIDLSLATAENKSRDKQKGTYRPYRHFTNVWILFAFVELENINTLTYARALLLNYSPDEGWSAPSLDYGSTWINAIAFAAFSNYINNANLIELINSTQPTYNIGHAEMKKILTPNKNKVFIVHGHDENDLRALERTLSKELSLTPVIVKDSPNDAIETIIQKVRRLASDCYSAIILLTPDDQLLTPDGVEYMQARPNVILEIGICIEKCEGRIILLRKQGCTLFSDIDGLLYIEYKSEVKDVFLELRNQLNHFGAN